MPARTEPDANQRSSSAHAWTAFHATQDPISGPVSPSLGANAQIGVIRHEDA